MTTHREPDPEGDTADLAPPLEAVDDSKCTSCGEPLNDDGECETVGCPKSIVDDLDDEFDDEDDPEDEPYPEGMLGEGDKDA